ncbi:unnamed protein product [Rotaria socialis]|uniref:Uncharacterized protein n=1 Tax=Rotaria socialis TaxID=392032 RepID=A0A818H8N3_9BILA|nr:unnamed protein product [Rotaria socialis]CAF3420127.1 unnamed protein product [Rotaria socialis]CAF3430118.1 unnamed protein product [Rotaria socialis]CAF3490145.1 unnamed protein product [Rotaria socialis]CAF3503917.1 unnamed protein product [Rotaria socialis]
MTVMTKVEKVGLDYLLSRLNASQKLVVHIRRTPNYNDTIDITVSDNSDDSDQPNPLQVPEIIIVISVLLLWCVSIIIFIRHSELLRIRHRDLPTRRTIEPPISLNRVTSVKRTSDMFIHSKSRMSSASIVTPVLSRNRLSGCIQSEKMETISLSIPLVPRKRRSAHSFDLNSLLLTKCSFDKREDKELLLHPYHIPSEVKHSLLDLHRKSIDSVHRKSTGNLPLTKRSIFHSTNDVSKRRNFINQSLMMKKMSSQDLPV